MMKSLLLFGALTTAALSLNAQTTIFNETFTVAADDNSLPSGWTSPDTDDPWYSSITAINSLLSPMGFTGQVALSNVYSSNPEDLLISPQINLPLGGASTLTYKVGVITVGGQYPGNTHYALYILPAANTFTGSETPVLEEVITVPDQAITKTISLASFAGQNVKLYFRHNNTSERYLALDDVNVTAPTVLGTSETANNTQVGIYPNPATDFITIKAKSEIISTEIYDVTGRKVSNQLKSDKIDIRNLLPGNYILNINTKQGKSSAKFIKKD